MKIKIFIGFNRKILLWIAHKLLRQARGYPCEQRTTSRMPMGEKRKADWNKFRVENKKLKEAAALEKKQKQEAAQNPMALARPLPMMALAQPLPMMLSAYPLLSTPTSHVSRVVLAQPVPIQATTSVAAYVTAPATEAVTDAAAAAAQELAVEVLSTLASLEEERTDAQAQAYAAEILKNYTPPPRKAQRPSTPVDPRISEIAAYYALAKINRC